jgi:CBS domain containing-hemolysin-like protein
VAERGDEVAYDGMRFDVLEVEGNRIERIAVTFLERPQRRHPTDPDLLDEDELE